MQSARDSVWAAIQEQSFAPKSAIGLLWCFGQVTHFPACLLPFNRYVHLNASSEAGAFE